MTHKIVCFILVMSILAHLHWLRGELLDLSVVISLKKLFWATSIYHQFQEFPHEERKNNNCKEFSEFV